MLSGNLATICTFDHGMNPPAVGCVARSVSNEAYLYRGGRRLARNDQLKYIPMSLAEPCCYLHLIILLLISLRFPPCLTFSCSVWLRTKNFFLSYLNGFSPAKAGQMLLWMWPLMRLCQCSDGELIVIR